MAATLSILGCDSQRLALGIQFSSVLSALKAIMPHDSVAGGFAPIAHDFKGVMVCGCYL